MSRPKDLPDFVEPPLDEVVLGVQFEPVPGYATVDAAGIWALYRAEFPQVEEQVAIPPIFETFGGSTPQAGFQFQFGQMPMAGRLWFISDDGTHLLQFQPDRFLLNWRKHQGILPYPRYEQICGTFERELRKLADHLKSDKLHSLAINQVEISYINVIPVEEFGDLGRWVSLWKSPSFDVESTAFTFTEVVKDENDRPVARLHYELTSGILPDGRGKVFRLTITYRGRPDGGRITESLAFMGKGRKLIVERFGAITTETAHKIWKRVV